MKLLMTIGKRKSWNRSCRYWSISGLNGAARVKRLLRHFMNSPAILTHTRRPTLLQPKYELDSSRRAAESFLTGFFHSDAAVFRRALRDEHECRYLLIDRFTLGFLSSYTAGLRAGEAPAPETAAASLLSQDDDTLESLPGYDLLWRSPDTILQRDGSPYDLYRLYRLSAD